MWCVCANEQISAAFIYTFSRWYNKLAKTEVCIIITASEWTWTIPIKYVCNKFRMCTNFSFSVFFSNSFFFSHCHFRFSDSLHHAYKLLFVWHNMHIFCREAWAWSAQHHYITITICFSNDGAIFTIMCTKFRIIQHDDEAAAVDDDDDNSDYMNKSNILF